MCVFLFMCLFVLSKIVHGHNINNLFIYACGHKYATRFGGGVETFLCSVGARRAFPKIYGNARVRVCMFMSAIL